MPTAQGCLKNGLLPGFSKLGGGMVLDWPELATGLELAGHATRPFGTRRSRWSNHVSEALGWLEAPMKPMGIHTNRWGFLGRQTPATDFSEKFWSNISNDMPYIKNLQKHSKNIQAYVDPCPPYHPYRISNPLYGHPEDHYRIRNCGGKQPNSGGYWFYSECGWVWHTQSLPLPMPASMLGFAAECIGNLRGHHLYCHPDCRFKGITKPYL